MTGLLPITGVPLPLVSFGGSALVVTLAGIGVLASVARSNGGGGCAAVASRERQRAVNVVVAGGGTAGHVFPALAMADALARTAWRDRDRSSVRTTDRNRRSYRRPGYPFTAVRVVSAQTRVSMRSVGALGKALRSSPRLSSARSARADVVVGIGGFASAPAALAARRARRPLVLVEQNSVPGAVEPDRGPVGRGGRA